MKRIISTILVAISLVLFLPSCQKAPFLTVNGPKSFTFKETGGSQTFTFSANRDWKVSSSDSWVRVSPSSGTASDGEVTVTITCDPNTTYGPRNTTLTVKVEDLMETISVSQETNYAIIVPTKSYDLTSDANTIEIDVQANVQYAVSISDSWVKQTGTKGLTSNKLTFNVEENDTYDARSATITIKPQNATVQEQVISVKQAQKDALIVKDSSFNLPYGGGGIEVKVESNVSFDVTPSVDWIHHVSTKALSNSTISLTIDENTTYSTREGKIEIKQKNGSLSHTLAVKQAGRIAVTSIELNKTSLTLKEGETESLTAAVKPDNATDKTVTWSSSEPSIAIVDETGNVTAIAKGEATITAKAGEQISKCYITVISVLLPDVVDLGLSVKWASFNLGASNPWEFGCYFAWGDCNEKKDYSWDNYLWWDKNLSSLRKYNFDNSLGPVDNKAKLELTDDSANILWGQSWRTPSKSEFQELFDNCTIESTSINGNHLWILTSLINGESIILPMGGFGNLSGPGTNVNVTASYWTSDLNEGNSREAFSIVFYYSGKEWTFKSFSRSLGPTIRPVTE